MTAAPAPRTAPLTETFCASSATRSGVRPTPARGPAGRMARASQSSGQAEQRSSSAAAGASSRERRRLVQTTGGHWLTRAESVQHPAWWSAGRRRWRWFPPRRPDGSCARERAGRPAIATGSSVSPAVLPWLTSLSPVGVMCRPVPSTDVDVGCAQDHRLAEVEAQLGRRRCPAPGRRRGCWRRGSREACARLARDRPVLARHGEGTSGNRDIRTAPQAAPVGGPPAAQLPRGGAGHSTGTWRRCSAPESIETCSLGRSAPRVFWYTK